MLVFMAQGETFFSVICDIFLTFAPNIDFECLLEPPLWGGSNEYPQSMFLNQTIRKILYTPVNPTYA